jgi:hypothetical protein
MILVFGDDDLIAPPNLGLLGDFEPPGLRIGRATPSLGNNRRTRTHGKAMKIRRASIIQMGLGSA